MRSPQKMCWMAAKAGDALALEVMDTVCYYLGWALATISMTVDPEIFVIGGGVSKAGTFLTDWLTAITAN